MMVTFTDTSHCGFDRLRRGREHEPRDGTLGRDGPPRDVLPPPPAGHGARRRLAIRGLARPWRRALASRRRSPATRRRRDRRSGRASRARRGARRARRGATAAAPPPAAPPPAASRPTAARTASTSRRTAKGSRRRARTASASRSRRARRSRPRSRAGRRRGPSALVRRRGDARGRGHGPLRRRGRDEDDASSPGGRAAPPGRGPAVGVRPPPRPPPSFRSARSCLRPERFYSDSLLTRRYRYRPSS